MKLSVLIASRGRATQLMGVVAALDGLKEGNVEYCLRVDKDDHASIAAARSLEEAYPCKVIVGDRPKHLASTTNDLAAAATGDAFLIVGDDVFPLNLGWDGRIWRAMGACPQEVAWVRQPNDPDPVIPVITRKWYEAAGRIFVERFPFWFADTWLVEVLMFAYDGTLRALPVEFGGNRGKTQRLRDLEFWARIFQNAREERIEEAKRICAKLGIPFTTVNHERTLQGFLAADRNFIARCAAMEQQFGDPEPPSESYLALKAEEEGRNSARDFADRIAAEMKAQKTAVPA